ncbi:NADH-quinone oxidoreductase subunit M [Hyphobacterium sp. HN65]|uniref:NADH-quinone oxidoreductase subunit M n=1 Tax=Hyphobacterium lacteum TaxID=3116575 RepID=A0ABU7LNG4_9PROT|nr:NADH-quinone oxidoreductase subunit M [Hyphobacterium sp. HN65]MEE2524879.1 NADH-quinone oxidoreductase subunit M [Hyphobacterium sp. HN65]
MLLSAVTFAPLAGALVITLFKMFSRAEDSAFIEKNARGVALLTTLVTFALSIVVMMRFDASNPGFQLVEEVNWFSDFGMGYRMGVDGLSVLFVLLTAFLMPISILASWKIEKRVADYMIAFLVLETLMIGVFCALDMVLFYVFFEGGLIPMFLIIGVWGGANRVYAAFKFFLYTLLGSVLMLVAMVFMFQQAGTTDITVLLEHDFAANIQTWLWLAFFASFAVKMPMWPVHTWLPDAHVQAPTAGSVILAGVLLKMGGYGFLRFSLPMFPDASAYFTPLVFVLSVIAIIYTSLVAFRQTDIKKLIAYSSVAHMGLVTMGLFAMTELGVQGAIFQMISHGVISGALFLAVGVIYDRMHTREIAFYGGLVHRMPVYAAVLALFTMANVGLPGTSGFVGEIMAMAGTFQVSTWAAAGAAVGVILSAVYMLNAYKALVLGDMTNPKLEAINDMNVREWAIFMPLIIATLVLGFFSTLITDVTAASVEQLISNYQAAIAASAQ